MHHYEQNPLHRIKDLCCNVVTLTIFLTKILNRGIKILIICKICLKTILKIIFIGPSRASNKESTKYKINCTAFATFLEEVNADYQNASPQLCTALDKFAERYRSAKSKSLPRLISYLYDLNRNLDSTARVKSGSMIRVQVESVKRRKTEGSGRKRKLPNTICKEKENLDPHIIPARKKKVAAKKGHNLSMNIARNQPN